MIESKGLIFLYDLPRTFVNSVKITDIILNACGYELTEPVSFKQQKSDINHPLINGVIRVDLKEVDTVAKAIKYFEIKDKNNNVWHCRALPFDKDLCNPYKDIINENKCVFLR